MKIRRNVPERRTRISVFPEYVEVWDLREGWQDGAYKFGTEQSLSAIAERLHWPKSSVASAYRAAFKRIIGQEFSSEIWFRVMGPMKLPAFNDDPANRLAARYRQLMHSNKPKPVPETSLQGKAIGRGKVGLVESQSTIESDHATIDLELDIQTLLGRGLADGEIAKKLELNDSSIVQYFRERLTEMKDKS